MRYLTVLLLTIGLLFFPSLIYHVAVVDGPEVAMYGFPLPWMSDSLATSLGKDIYLMPLLVDFIFYAVLSFFLWKWISARSSKSGKNSMRALAGIIGLYGLTLGLFFALSVTQFPPYASVWYEFPFKILRVRIGLAI